MPEIVDGLEHRLELDLAAASPFHWPAMLAFYRFRAVAGVEVTEAEQYRRSIRLGDAAGILTITQKPEDDGLSAIVETDGPLTEDIVAARLRAMFDLDTDTSIVMAHFEQDPVLGPLVSKRPFLRIPAHWEPFETAVRAVLGQQVSLVAARQLNARLVDRAGQTFRPQLEGIPHRLFPTPGQLLQADLSNMGMPGARVRTILALAEAFLGNDRLFSRMASVEETVERLCLIKGIGPWTAHYIALRACRDPDAFPSSDIGLLRGAADAEGQRPTVAVLTECAEAWRPYRAYAAHHIWAEDEARAAADAEKPKPPKSQVTRVMKPSPKRKVSPVTKRTAS